MFTLPRAAGSAASGELVQAVFTKGADNLGRCLIGISSSILRNLPWLHVFLLGICRKEATGAVYSSQVIISA